MKDTNLVDVLRAYEEWAEWNHRETPIAMGDNLAEAADVIEVQAKEIEKLRAQPPHWGSVEERLQEVHGQWNADETCSVCGKKSTEGLDATKWNYWFPNYCPNCGAKMDEGDDNACL